MNTSLSGEWKWCPDPKDKGIAKQWFSSGNDWETTTVPGCWNTEPRYERYEGTFWYEKKFFIDQEFFSGADHRIFLRFKAVSYFCRVWVNGTEIGSHEGGYLPFELEIPKEILKSTANRLTVMVENNRTSDRIPGKLCDWFNYGGIVRDVELQIRSVRRFSSVKFSSVIRGEDSASISVDWRQEQPFSFTWAIVDADETIASGRCDGEGDSGLISIDVGGVEFWSPENPKLYRLVLTPCDSWYADSYETRIGIREIKVDGSSILLNGKPLKMQGVSLHEELVPYGRSIPREERFRDVRDIKDLGFNALRTAHYTHDESLMDAADEIGLLILEEIPVYWDLDYSSSRLFDLASSMVRDMIKRDINHPSVILWSVGNEVPVEKRDCDKFIRGLMDIAREMDSTRIVTYVSCRFMIDETRRDSDVCCINCYIGWYYGNERDLKSLLDLVRETAPDQPWMMTEFGAGAAFGFHSRRKEKFSEENQEKILRHYIRTLNSLDWIAGWFIWIYRDFRSPIRMNKHQKGFNRKGIVSEDRQQKKICESFPKLLSDTLNIESKSPPRLKVFLAEKLEELAYTTVQPLLAKAQGKQYDDFYSKKI